MRRPVFFWSLCLAGLSVLACKGQEVTVFDMPMAGGSSGAAASGAAGSESAGSSAVAGDTSSGDIAGQAGLATGGSGGTAAGSASSAGTAGMPAGTPCSDHDDCFGWLCEKPGCDAPTGVCEPPPVFLPREPAPVCGCDGVTYWNDDIRRKFGTTLSSLGECSADACACEVGADCAVPYASCSHLSSRDEMCGHGMGACWVLPPKCVPTGDPMVWQECRPPDAPGPPPPCVDTCLAIASERPHAPPHHDACP